MAAREGERLFSFFVVPLRCSVPLGAMHHPSRAAPERMDLSHFGRFQNRFRNSFIFSDFPRLPALIPSLSVVRALLMGLGGSMRGRCSALALALVASKWIWKSQCNERVAERERAGKGRGSAKDVFGVRLLRSLARPLARSLAAAFWKMDRVTLRPRPRRRRRRFLFARAVSGFFSQRGQLPLRKLHIWRSIFAPSYFYR